MNQSNTAHSQKEPITLTETEARQAIAPGRLRYMLGVSLSLTIIGMAVVYFIFFH